MRIITFIFGLFICVSAHAQFKQDIRPTSPKKSHENLEINLPANKPLRQASQKSNVIDQVTLRPSLIPVVSDKIKVESRNEWGIPSKISYEVNNGLDNRTNIDQMAEEVLIEIQTSFGPTMENQAFKKIDVLYNSDTETHLKYQQSLDGVAVHYSDIRLHFNKSDQVLVTGDLYPLHKGINTIPALSPLEAEQLTKALFPNRGTISDKVMSYLPYEIEEELVIYHKNADPSDPVLAYVIHYYPDALHQWEVVIDAMTGDVIKKYTASCSLHNHSDTHNDAYSHADGDNCDHNTTHDEEISSLPPDGPRTSVATDLFGQNKTIQTYEVSGKVYFIDASRSMYNAASSSMPNDPNGVIWTLDAFNSSPQNNNFDYDHVESSSNNFSGREEAVSAHVNAGAAYEYFKNVHGRNSINGSAGNIVSFVNVSDEFGNSMGNAYWNGAAMWYGNGDSAFEPLAKGLDVAGHELTHGVVQSTANLEYYGESGAMNESFADIFGVMIDPGDWKIGEDVVKTSEFPSGALRDMQDPHNGAAFQDYGGGWQPKHTDEQFNGSQDNNGVHINSGIPNHAYYLFATTVGTTKAEKVFYRALTIYLTKSSKFVDLRNAVEQATKDLYGSGSELAAAQNAFAAVGIGQGSGGSYEEDVVVNPGQDFVIYTNANRQGLFIYDFTDKIQISNSNPISRPSVSDDGSEIVFIADDKQMHYIFIDWSTGNVDESIIQSDPIWRNVVVSKDGQRIAAIFDEINNVVWLYDFNIGASNTYELFNPTFTEGVSTGDVLYADALEFDFSGEYLMYDANNQLVGNSGTIEYWDVGFLKVWNNDAETWSLGDIQKLFSNLPEGVSIGNPTFSKNSPYIIAFDYFDPNNNKTDLLSSNIERGDVGLLYENSVLSYPSFSKTDEQMIFDAQTSNGATVVGILDLEEDKLATTPGSEFLLLENARWGVWFSNGDRDLISSVHTTELNEQLSIYPSITSGPVNVESLGTQINYISVYNMNGQQIMRLRVDGLTHVLDLQSLQAGMYVIRLSTDHEEYSKKIIKL